MLVVCRKKISHTQQNMESMVELGIFHKDQHLRICIRNWYIHQSTEAVTQKVLYQILMKPALLVVESYIWRKLKLEIFLNVVQEKWTGRIFISFSEGFSEEFSEGLQSHINNVEDEETFDVIRMQRVIPFSFPQRETTGRPKGLGLRWFLCQIIFFIIL